jgi:hypothetical protein
MAAPSSMHLAVPGSPSGRFDRGSQVRYLGFDLSPRMLAQARRHADRLGLHQVELAQADAEMLPLEDTSADLFLSYFGLQCLPHPDAAIREAARCLRVGGPPTPRPATSRSSSPGSSSSPCATPYARQGTRSPTRCSGRPWASASRGPGGANRGRSPSRASSSVSGATSPIWVPWSHTRWTPAPRARTRSPTCWTAGFGRDRFGLDSPLRAAASGRVGRPSRARSGAGLEVLVPGDNDSLESDASSAAPVRMGGGMGPPSPAHHDAEATCPSQPGPEHSWRSRRWRSS